MKKAELKKLLSEAQVNAEHCLAVVTESEGSVSCSMSYDAGYYAGQLRVLSNFLNIEPPNIEPKWRNTK